MTVGKEPRKKIKTTFNFDILTKNQPLHFVLKIISFSLLN